MTTGWDIYHRALTQVHSPPYPYVFGRAPTPPDDCHLGADCSGFTRWVALSEGVTLPAGSWLQKSFCAAAGFRPVPPSQAIVGQIAGHDGTGAEGHVVIVGPNGTTVEARGKAYGIGVFGIAGRPFQWAYNIPGVDYSNTFGPQPAPGAPPAPPLKEIDMVLVPGSGPNPVFGNRVPYWSVRGKQLLAFNGAPLWQDEHGSVQSAFGVQYIEVPSTGDLTGLALLPDGVTLAATADADGGSFLYRTK